MENYLGEVAVFKALADANRLRIIEVLSTECKSVNEIAELAGLSQPLTSHHLKVLTKIGITRLESRANFNYYWVINVVIWKIIEECNGFVHSIVAQGTDI